MVISDFKDSILADALELKGAANYRAKRLSKKYGWTDRTLVKIIREVVPVRAKVRTEADYHRIKALYADSDLVSDHQKIKHIAQVTRWSYGTVKNVVLGKVDENFKLIKNTEW